MIVIASENDIRVPIYDKNVEDIKDYMSYYKFVVKQLVQAKNVLEAMNHNQSNKHILKSLEKKIDTFQKESLEIIMKIKKIISQDQLLYQSFNNIKTIKAVPIKLKGDFPAKFDIRGEIILPFAGFRCFVHRNSPFRL